MRPLDGNGGATAGCASAAPLLAKLETLDHLRAGESLPCNADGALAPRLLIAGWACRNIILPDGRRQILGFILPGDSVGGSSPELPLNRMNANALTPVRLAALSSLLHQDDGDTRQYAAAIVEEQRLLLDQIVRLGRLSAFERTIHLLLELHERLMAVGLADGDSFDCPLTQDVLADALGLSIVHVNRVMQKLRRERLIESERRRVTLIDRERLKASCDYGSAERRPLLNVRRLGIRGS